VPVVGLAEGTPEVPSDDEDEGLAGWIRRHDEYESE
jgi:hypothetical protein